MQRKLLYSEDQIALGLLVLRIGIGLAFMAHGFPKVFMGGAVGLAKGLAATGIPGGVFGAYLAGGAEFFGGIALILGIVFRPVMVIMAFNMLIATLYHVLKGASYVEYSHALESCILFIALLVSGPGKYSLDYKFWASANEKEPLTKEHPHLQPRQRRKG